METKAASSLPRLVRTTVSLPEATLFTISAKCFLASTVVILFIIHLLIVRYVQNVRLEAQDYKHKIV